MADPEAINDLPPVEEYKVFVGGIPFHYSTRELQAAFDKFGAVDAMVIIDKLTNKSRGFGFVKFSDEAGRDEAITQMNQAELDGRQISVTKAIPQDQTAPGTPASALGGGRRGGERGYSRPYERGYDRGYDRYRAPPAYDRYSGGYGRAPAYDARYPGGYSAPAYDRPYEPYAARDPYMPSYEFDRGYHAYGGYDDRYRPGPDRRPPAGGYGGYRGPYDRRR